MVVSSKCAEPRPKKTDARTQFAFFGTISSGASDDRSERTGTAAVWYRSFKYAGVDEDIVLNVSAAILYVTRCLNGSQWNDIGLASVQPPRWQTTLARLFCVAAVHRESHLVRRRAWRYCIITTCSVECYWHCSDGTLHYKSDKTVNFGGFTCATTSPITVFINFVFTFIQYCI